MKIEDHLESASPAAYKAMRKILTGHAVTPCLDSYRYMELYKGTKKHIDELSRYETSRVKPGLFMTKQPMTKPTHRDQDIREYRTFVVEFDDHSSIEEQRRLIESSGLPFTYQVFSGNKSLHTGIILKEGISIDEVRAINIRLAKIFPTADRKVLNSLAQLVRFPVENNQHYQPLIGYRGLVENEALYSFISNKEYEMGYHKKVDANESIKNEFSKSDIVNAVSKALDVLYQTTDKNKGGRQRFDSDNVN